MRYLLSMRHLFQKSNILTLLNIQCTVTSKKSKKVHTNRVITKRTVQ